MKMHIIQSEQISPWDVDGTLILPHDGINTVYVKDPINPEICIAMTPHTAMVRLLKEERHRGAHIIVWSRGGYEWATNVVRALDLESYVHIVMSKPTHYFDDLDVAEWMKDRVYLKPGTIYKK